MALRGKLLQYFVFFTGSINVLLTGFHLGWPSPSLPILLSNSSTIPLTNDQGSWIASSFLIGGICGSILSALILDVIGRKKSLLIASVPLLGTWLLIAFAQTPIELFVSRFIAGVSDNVFFSCLPLYLGEICDSNIRGFFISGIFVIYLFGAFLVNVLGTFFSIPKIAFIFSGLSCLATVLTLFVPESPYFYVIKDDIKKARIGLQRFNKDGNVDDCLNLIKNTLIEQKSDYNRWWHPITDPNNRRGLLLVMFLRTFQQFTGFAGIVFYIQTLFKNVEEGTDPIVYVTIYYFLQISMSIVNALIVDKVGRRPLLIASMSTVLVALSIVSSYFTLQNVSKINVSNYSWIPILGLFLYIIGYALGLHSTATLFAGELFSLHVKSFAVGVSNVLYCLFGSIASKFFQYTKDEYGLHVPFIIFTIISALGLPYIILYIPETKKKTIEEIQKELRSKKVNIM